jgi:hypothetical protein
MTAPAERLPEAERVMRAAWYLLKLFPGLLCTDLSTRERGLIKGFRMFKKKFKTGK